MTTTTNIPTQREAIQYIQANHAAAFEAVDSKRIGYYSLSRLDKAAFDYAIMLQKREAYAQALEAGIQGKEMQSLYNAAQAFERRYRLALRDALGQ